jgi:hypothetical protein
MAATFVRRRRAGLVLSVLAGLVVLATGCVEGSGFGPANARRLFVPSVRTGLASTGEVPLQVSGQNWGPGRPLALEECAFALDVAAACEPMGSIITDPDGTFPLTTVNVHYLLAVGGGAVACDSVVDPNPVLGVLGAINGGVFYSRHCALRVRPIEADLGGPLDVWISFAAPPPP